jgi:hypothetical protein
MDLSGLLRDAGLSLTSFDGAHCVRIDFETRAEAERALDLLEAIAGEPEPKGPAVSA